MNQTPYSYIRENDFYYTFVSKGKNAIVKIVEFTALEGSNLFNLYFGDILPYGTVDDGVNSNNGDIVRVMSTVISITMDFFDRHPDSKVFFTGRTRLRTAMYHRILKMYHMKFILTFKITVTVWEKNDFKEIEFDPMNRKRPFSFLIEKKN